MDSAKKCLELLDTKLWLIEFELQHTITSVNRCTELSIQYDRLHRLRVLLVGRYPKLVSL